MKKLFFILCVFLLLGSIAWAISAGFLGSGSVPVAAGDECDGKIVCQNFEGTGYDNSETWVESGSVVDEDEDSLNIRGLQSLQLDDSASGTPRSGPPVFSDESTIWMFFRMEFPGAIPAGNCLLLSAYSNVRGDPGTNWSLSFRSADNYLRLSNGGTNVDTGSQSIAADTVYYIWINTTTSTGSDGYAGIYLGTTTTRPSLTNSTSDGTFTEDVNFVDFVTDCGCDVIFDQVLIDDAEIGNVDS